MCTYKCRPISSNPCSSIYACVIFFLFDFCKEIIKVCGPESNELKQNTKVYIIR